MSSSFENMLKISSVGWWIVHTTVRPFCASRWIARTKSSDMPESRPDVGSSRYTMLGRWMISTATAASRRCPLESPPMSLLATCSSPSSASTYRTRPATCAAVGRPSRSMHATRSVSLTVSVLIITSCCITYASHVERCSKVGVVPLYLRSALPKPVVLRPASQSRNVDLPAPLGPMMAHSSPGCTSKLTSRSSGLTNGAPCSFTSRTE